MILVLGGSGYVGSAFVRHLSELGIDCRSISRTDVDYYDVEGFSKFLRDSKPEFVINAAGYTGKPNVDACELHKADCLLGNAVLPGLLKEACELASVPWGHVSSGCIYTGDKGTNDSGEHLGFTETDPPNFSFRQNNCSFYSGCKAIGEECVSDAENVFVWRLRIPFNHVDSSRNYLSKVMRYQRLLEARNSISNLDEFVVACVSSWQKRIPFGIYNVTNTGSVTTSEVAEILKTGLDLERDFQFFESEEEFMDVAAKAARSNCVMDNSKLVSCGIHMSGVHDAINTSLKNWKWENVNL